jgi:hypothetical protein
MLQRLLDLAPCSSPTWALTPSPGADTFCFHSPGWATLCAPSPSCRSDFAPSSVSLRSPAPRTSSAVPMTTVKRAKCQTLRCLTLPVTHLRATKELAFSETALTAPLVSAPDFRAAQTSVRRNVTPPTPPRVRATRSATHRRTVTRTPSVCPRVFWKRRQKPRDFRSSLPHGLHN